MFGYNRRLNGDFLDLLLPDYTHWGHEYSQIVGESFQMRSASARITHVQAHAPVYLCRLSVARRLSPPLLVFFVMMNGEFSALNCLWQRTLPLLTQRQRWLCDIRFPCTCQQSSCSLTDCNSPVRWVQLRPGRW